MRLGDLIKALPSAVLIGDDSLEIVDVDYDSRRVAAGVLFAAVPGLTVDGRRFIPSAVSSGASAVMVEQPLDFDPGVPVITVPEVRSAMATAAALVHGRPSDKIYMVGITGTNGKTTTTYLLESILKAAGACPGVLGTVNFRYGRQIRPAANTTPEGPDLQRMLEEMVDSGTTHAIMEASSHALDLSRVEGCDFDVAVFTNLTQDHLDYHRDFETYFKAKQKLFMEYLTGQHLSGPKRAVVNIDDPWGQKLADLLGGAALSTAMERPADVRALDCRTDRGGITARVETPLGPLDLRSRLLGRINIYNMLSAIGTAVLLGIDAEAITRGLAASSGAPGRLERVGGRDEYLVLVDYAHTPDALANALRVVRDLGPERLITVFGCGGDRDRTKRPLMGRAAAEMSDLAIITSDNPRTEDPLAIIEDIEAGLSGLNRTRLSGSQVEGPIESQSFLTEPDRGQAIKLACRIMEPGDILLVAGKGHEDYQVLGREKFHFDDREIAGEALKKWGKF